MSEIRMSAADYKSGLAKPKKGNKFGAKKVKEDGHTFDSKREYKRYCENKIRLRAGEIADLQLHPKFDVGVGDDKICTYTADSSYLEFYEWDGKLATRFVVEDVKSVITAKKRDYVLVKKLMKAVHGIEIREVF